ncbi:MAG: substrate-binding domain-containing protein [Anaerolineales bacterium]|nr:substrate-binding domain-containing protein [Anaerolineales bacterium]
MSTADRITIREIAQQAGVSTQTVSRVINQRPDVAQDTRQRVQAVIDATGYFPNRLAQGLTRGRTRTIGVIISGLPLYGPSYTLAGLDKQAQALGFDLAITLIHQEKDIPSAVRQLRAQNVAGVLWSVNGPAGKQVDEMVDSLCSNKIPVVLLSTSQKRPLTSVIVDNFSGSRLAVEHLQSEGCRQIGVITGRMSERSAQERLRGWRLTTSNPDPAYVVRGDWSAASGYQGMRQLLAIQPNIDGVFASNDQMALGVLRAAAQLGRTVPQDLAVIGFDDIPEAAYYRPSLSTVRQDLGESTRLAMQALSEQIHASAAATTWPVQTITLQPQLVIRESSRLGRSMPPARTQAIHQIQENDS